MKTMFLIQSLLFSLVLGCGLYAQDFSRGYKQISCTITPIDRKVVRGVHPHIPAEKDQLKKSSKVVSTNWSGYVAAADFTTPSVNSVSAVYGSWIVPTIGTNSNSYAAFWIGIDGYTSSTVEQIGTSHSFVNGVKKHFAWFEMYPRGSFSVGGFPLAAGDVISASVVYSGDGIFTMNIYNNTREVYATVPTIYTKSLTAKRSCAEWIVEAPFLNGTLPLNNFTTAYLWGCIANISGILSLMNNSSWPNTAITMITNTGTPKAIPSVSLQDNSSFFITWKHA